MKIGAKKKMRFILCHQIDLNAGNKNACLILKKILRIGELRCACVFVASLCLWLFRIQGSRYKERENDESWLSKHFAFVAQLLVKDLKIVKVCCCFRN